MKKNKIDIPLIIIFLVAVTALVLSLVPQVVFIADEEMNKVLKDAITRLCFGDLFFYLIITSKWIDQLKFHFDIRALLWSIPVILVALVNFPYSSLILGTSRIIKPEFAGVLVFYCLSVSLLEELFFRVLLFSFITEKLKNNKHHYLLTIIITSVIFGLWHLVNLVTGAPIIATLMQVGYTFLIGCMLCVTFTVTKNIWFCILVHSVFDLGGFIITMLGEGDFQDMWFWILTITMMVICGVWILITTLKINKKENENLVVQENIPEA